MEFVPSQAVNIAHELNALINEAKPDIYREVVDINEVCDFIDNYKFPDDLFISDKICPYLSMNPYEWYYDFDDTITLILKNVEMKYVEINEYEINSPKLKGKWFSKIENIDMSFSDNKTTIKFKPTKHFCVLIKGGSNIDPLSLFYLSLLSLKVNNIIYFKKLCSMAAEAGDPNAQYFIGRYFYNISDFPTAIYWLAHSVLDYANIDCTSDLAYILWRLKTKYQNPLLAENLLCDLCKNKFPNAYVELGEMYLYGCGQVKANPEKAGIILKIAFEDFHSEKAEQLLKEYNEKGFSNIDIIIVASGIIGLASMGYILYRRYFSRRK